ncbi:very-long-chain 3-oxoacyl-CoA reductase-like protein [Panicum miliaceum]|uniref:Very-long-chain 3-oxoacyl-CoA reductase-like protein n=1 Tax=Panicum miliaceum TaxID=4540 RepID=A0A3L6Q4Q3_PANMI|nr:very-long-chain 3-oxoacyl-CoA reductase-like protein [Panicum miliaceum]
MSLLLSATEVSKMVLLAADQAPWPASSSPAPVWFALLVALGLLVVLRSAAAFLAWLHRAFLRPGRDLAGRYGTWAVVTGATDGIGRTVALELARRGLHLVLVGRSPDKLARVGKEVLAAAPSCKVRTVAFDLAATGDDARRGVARVAAAVEGRDVGVLVNNAGATYPCAAYFHEVEDPEWEAVVRVNVEAATRITRAVVPLMAARGRGAVVNVGSGSSVVVPAFPLYAVYAASKAYVDQFSRSLSVEYKQYGVDVQCQIPLYVATKMSPVKGDSPFIPSPEVYAKASLRCIGYEARCLPYWRHSVQWFLASLVADAALNQWRLRIGIRKRNEMKALVEEKVFS